MTVKIAVLSIEPSQLEDVTWHLPPSKSHAIRWTLMGAGGGGTCRLIGADGSGRDARAMHRMVQQLGGRIETEEGDWIIHGVGASGFTRPPSVPCREQWYSVPTHQAGHGRSRDGRWRSESP